MRAVLLHEYGDVNQLRYEEAEMPKFGAQEVLVKVRATSVNPIDWKIRSGEARARMPINLPTILGRDLAGEIVDIGSDVKGLSKGMRVMGLTNRTYAEFTSAKAEDLAPIPESISFEQAAALPLVTLTGAQLIELGVKPKAGQTVLVTGALGSVGRTAVHVAKQHGAKVLAGVRASEKRTAEGLEVDRVVAIDDDEEIDQLHDLDAIADTVGGMTISKLLKSIRAGGVLGSVLGQPKDAPKYNIQVNALMSKPDSSRLRQLAEEVGRGEFSIPVVQVLPLSDIQEAHKLAESGHAGGKIVLVP